MSLSEDVKTMYSQAPKASSWMYSQAPKASSWGTCETVKHPGAPAKQPSTMYFRSQTASKTQPLTSLSEDLKTMYSQAPNVSFSGTCETAKHHVFQVPNGVKNTASNVIFWRPKDMMYNQAPKASFSAACETAKQHPKPRPGAPAKQPKSRQKLQKSNPQAPSIRTGLLWRAPPYSEGSADIEFLNATQYAVIQQWCNSTIQYKTIQYNF